RADPRLRLWALTILGEIAIRRDDSAAEQFLKDALALDDRDVYALTVYADYLLDRGRAVEVLALLRGFERVDALYLRLPAAAQPVIDWVKATRLEDQTIERLMQRLTAGG